jgi:hypothetical protein
VADGAVRGANELLAALVDFGFARAADVIGGFAAWRDDDLPVQPAPEPFAGVLPGMGSRD